MENLRETVYDAQKGDKNALLEVITFFDPLIKKYFKLMNYDEDFKSELTIYLMELIRSINLSDFRILNDFTLINYIRTSVYHEYIFLSLIISPIYDTSFIVKFLLYKVFQILHRFNHSTNRDNIFFINLRFHNNSFSTICIPH